MRRSTEMLVEPLVEPVKEELPELTRRFVEDTAESISSHGVESPFNPLLMPGGVRDVQRFLLHLCAAAGGSSLCDQRSSCGFDTSGSEQLAQLGLNVAQLQVLATARRLFHVDLPEGTVDAAFVAHHSELLRRHEELPGGMFEDPDHHLLHLVRRNVELMTECLE